MFLMNGMNRFNRILILLSAMLFCTTVFMFFHTGRTINQNKKRHELQLNRIDQKLSQIEKRVDTLTAELNDPRRVEIQPGSSPPGKKREIATMVPKGQTISKSQEELNKLKEIIASTGLDRLSEKENIDPEILNKIYRDYAEQQKVLDYRQTLTERNAAQHDSDDERFDDELGDLYQRARLRRGEDPESEERKAAFAEMLEKYPDAYATAMVVSERAFVAMWSRDVKGVETYYNMLREGDVEVATNIVTDRGVEAMPNIELYLARQYLRGGREEEAGVLIESLESNYADSMVFSERRGLGRRWTTVSEALGQINSPK